MADYNFTPFALGRGVVPQFMQQIKPTGEYPTPNQLPHQPKLHMWPPEMQPLGQGEQSLINALTKNRPAIAEPSFERYYGPSLLDDPRLGDSSQFPAFAQPSPAKEKSALFKAIMRGASTDNPLIPGDINTRY